MRRQVLKFTFLAFFASFLAVAVQPAQANELILYIVPPPVTLRWDSPRDIARTAVAASLTSSLHNIGHITTKVSCRKKNGQKVEFWAGMSSDKDNPSYNSLILKEKLGLGVLFYDYKGYLEDDSNILPNVQRASRKFNRLFTLRFLINDQHCERLEEYHEDFKRSEAHKTYGLVHRPRFNEGAGCTAFAMSYLEVAGLLDSSLKQAWSKSIRIPEELIGSDENPVTIREILMTSAGKRWAHPYEDHRKLFFYDTQFMYGWAKAQRASGRLRNDVREEATWSRKVRLKKHPSGRGPLYKSVHNGFFGLILDKRNQRAARDSIWKD